MKQLLATCALATGFLYLPDSSTAGHYFYPSAPGVYRFNGYFPPTVYYGPFPQATYHYPRYLNYAPRYYGPNYYGTGYSFGYVQPNFSIRVSNYGRGRVPYSYGGRRGFQRGYRHR